MKLEGRKQKYVLIGGLALLLGGQSAVLLVNLTFGALIAGLFQGKARRMGYSCS